MNILVLAAGTSTEREVSISSGRMVCKALRQKGHNAVIADVFFGLQDANVFEGTEAGYDVDKKADEIASWSKKVKERLQAGAGLIGPNIIEAAKKADLVFLALHGSNGEDGRIQAMFDLLGIKYTGAGYLGSAMAMNKAVAKVVVKDAGVPVIKGISFSKKDKEAKQTLEELGFKGTVIVKPACGGSSVGVSKAENEEEYQKALKEAFALEDTVVVEQFVDAREFSIGVFYDLALPVIEIVVEKDSFYDYENKYNGKTKEVCPAPLEENIAKEMQAYAVQAAKALQLEAYCRIDFLLDKDNHCYFMEANTLPGMTPTSLLPQEAAQIGYDFPALCDKLVELSMEKYS